jgi:hypothetical protein
MLPAAATPISPNRLQAGLGKRLPIRVPLVLLSPSSLHPAVETGCAATKPNLTLYENQKYAVVGTGQEV